MSRIDDLSNRKAVAALLWVLVAGKCNDQGHIQFTVLLLNEHINTVFVLAFDIQHYRQTLCLLAVSAMSALKSVRAIVRCNCICDLQDCRQDQRHYSIYQNR